LTDDATFCLTAQSEQDDVVTRQDGVDELRNDRVVVADNARKKFVSRPKLSNQVQAQFVFDREGLIPARTKFAKVPWVIHV